MHVICVVTDPGVSPGPSSSLSPLFPQVMSNTPGPRNITSVLANPKPNTPSLSAYLSAKLVCSVPLWCLTYHAAQS